MPTKTEPVLNVAMTHLRAKFRTIPSNVFALDCMETLISPSFSHKGTEIGPLLSETHPVLNVVIIHLHAKFRAISSMRSP